MADATSDAWASGLAGRLPARVAAGLEAISRVARALTTPGALHEVAERALDAMRAAMDLQVCVLYLPDAAERPLLTRFEASPREGARSARDEIGFDPAAWQLAIAGGHPLVFNEPAGWVVPNPFEPPASHWLVVPLATSERLVGAVMAARTEPLELDALGVTVLSLLGDQLAAGVASAQLRLELQGAAIERERLRVAAEVHDGLAQDLALAVRELAFLATDPPERDAQGSRDRLRAAVTSAHKVVRDRLVDLSTSLPLGGVRTAVEEVCERFSQRGLPVRLTVEAAPVDTPPAVTAALVRVLSEALANAVKHAGAATVDVRLSAEPGAIALLVADDGSGFDPDGDAGGGNGHLGLSLMRSRASEAAGELEIRSAPGAGTTVRARFPLPSSL
jgi:signal transduction histidine kinase